jgi:hypothetical protein
VNAYFDQYGRLHIVVETAAGDVAHDAADSGNPVKIGGRALGGYTLPAAVSDADRVDALLNVYGHQYVAQPAIAAEIYALAARTSAPSSATYTNQFGMRGLQLFLYVSALADTPSVRVILYATDPISAQSKSVWCSDTITATGNYCWQFYPGAVGVAAKLAGFAHTEVLPFHPGIRWSVGMNHADTDSITYQLAYQYLP